jgi:phage FluMu gp28-like protein
MTTTQTKPLYRDKIGFKRKLYPKQRAAIMDSARYAIIEASTKSGKTHACIEWLISEAFERGRDGRNFWWIAPTYNQAKIAYNRMHRTLLPAPSFVKANAYEHSIFLDNGSKIRFLSAEKPDGLYGEDCYGAVLDEATRMREEAWIAIRSTLTATRGRARIIGNVKGKKNWAYRLARRAEAGEPDWHYARLTAYDAIEGKVLAEEEIEDARRLLPSDVFKELYEATATDDAGNPFGIEDIKNCITPLSGDEAVVYGVDLAKSVDWTVIIGLDASGVVCEYERFQLDWEHTEARIMNIIGSESALIDSTGVGDPIFERLNRQNPLIEGFKFSSTSKQQIMEGLAVAIQNREIGYPEGVISQELSDFEYVYTRTGTKYSAPDGLHDDAVCALALALHKFRNQPTFGIW